jgi:hypothetical protein
MESIANGYESIIGQWFRCIVNNIGDSCRAEAKNFYCIRFRSHEQQKSNANIDEIPCIL